MRNKRKMRRFNRGKFSVRSFMSGDRLPELSFGRCRFIAAPKEESYTDSSVTPLGYGNTIMVNGIVRPYALISSGPTAHSVRYYGLYNLLYKRYCVLGAKIKVRINPSMFTTATFGANEFKTLYEIDKVRYNKLNNNVVPDYAIANPNGYWYMRISMVDINGNVVLGHPLAPNESDVMTTIWSHPADFFNDRTVTWSRDRRTWQTGMEETIAKNSEGAWQYGPRIRTINTSMGGRNPTTYLTYKYSAKKMWEDKDILKPDSPHWATVAYNSGTLSHVPLAKAYVRYGYITWNNVQPFFYYPLDTSFWTTTEIDYYCGFRDPIEPHELENSLAAQQALKNRTAEDDYISESEDVDRFFEEDEEDELDVEALPELSREVTPLGG